MSRSQATPLSSQLLTISRLLEEKESKIERLTRNLMVVTKCKDDYAALALERLDEIKRLRVSHDDCAVQLRTALAERNAARSRLDRVTELLRNLVTGLGNAYITSWQSTEAWQKQLEEAQVFLEACPKCNSPQLCYDNGKACDPY